VLARSLFEKTEVDEVIAFKIPRTRAFMHLDTVLTQVDYDKFVIHPYIRKHSKLFSITKSGITELTLPLEQVLAKALEREKVTLINCGGDDMIASEREQWNDGSNTLCISPGKVIAYNRNVITNRILENNGIEIVQIPSSELSRGRGGPRCMSMPLLRGEL
ncbi:MAG: arginine deiminase, partial [Spirochaetales bacterium]|nr:arginine deiminase [Spirochaetales bacterium]